MDIEVYGLYKRTYKCDERESIRFAPMISKIYLDSVKKQRDQYKAELQQCKSERHHYKAELESYKTNLKQRKEALEFTRDEVKKNTNQNATH